MPPIRLPDRDVLDEKAKDVAETSHFADPATGERYLPDEPPAVRDPVGDEDAEA